VRTLLDWQREDGQTFAEYSVILAVITPAIILALALLSDGVAARIGAVASLFP
jgi:Flp pilus assembly pilin Flp